MRRVYVRQKLVKANRCLHVLRFLRKEQYSQVEIDHLFKSLGLSNFTYCLSVNRGSEADLNIIQHFLDRCYQRRFVSLPVTVEEVKPWSQDWIIAAGAYPGFCSMKRLEVFLLSLDGMLVHHRSLPSNVIGFPQQFAGTHLYTWVERGTVRVKCRPRTQHNVPGQGSNPDRSLRSPAH